MIEIFCKGLYNHDRFHLQFIHVHTNVPQDNSVSNLSGYSNIFNHPRIFSSFKRQHNKIPLTHDY